MGCLLAFPTGYVLLRVHAGPHPVDYVHAFLTHTRQLLRGSGWQQLLADERGMNPFSATEQAWIVDYWLARQHRASLPQSGGAFRGTGSLARLSRSSPAGGLTYHGFLAQATVGTWLCQLG